MNFLSAEFIGQVGVMGALFIWLLYDTRKASAKREEELLAIIKQQDKRMNEFSETLIKVNDNLEHLNMKIENMEGK